jgi:hypothetical protein
MKTIFKKRTGSCQFTEQMKLTPPKCGTSRWLPSALTPNPFWDSAGQGNSKNHVLRPFFCVMAMGRGTMLHLNHLSTPYELPHEPHERMNQHGFLVLPYRALFQKELRVSAERWLHVPLKEKPEKVPE